MAADGSVAWSLAAALSLLLALRLLAALLPLWAVARTRGCAGQRRLLLHASRFAGGVLLGTALLHMLPEAREQLPEHAWGGSLAEFLVGVGFLCIYVMEEAWHGRSRPPPLEPPPLAPPLQLPALTTVHHKPAAAAAPTAPACPWPPASRIAPADSTQHLLAAHGDGGDAGCTWALLLALGVHSLLEGFALGLQTTARDVWLLLAALSVHAVPLLLCVGAKVSASPVRRCSAAARLSLLAAAAPLGGVLGAVAGGAALGGAAGALQALAAGSLLFAALAEGLSGGGAAHDHHHEPRSLAAAALALVGFGLIAAMQLTVVHHHHHHDGDEVAGNMSSLSNSSEMEGHAHL